MLNSYLLIVCNVVLGLQPNSSTLSKKFGRVTHLVKHFSHILIAHFKLILINK